jgi:hypothetical protein
MKSDVSSSDLARELRIVPFSHTNRKAGVNNDFFFGGGGCMFSAHDEIFSHNFQVAIVDILNVIYFPKKLLQRHLRWVTVLKKIDSWRIQGGDVLDDFHGPALLEMF